MLNPEDLKKLVQYTKTLKLLFVEDSQDAREQALKLLKNFFVDITVCENGQDGLNEFFKNDFDLIISDLNMPIMGGLEMIRNIRLADTSIKIIVNSAHNETSYQDDANIYDIHAYMIKPVSVSSYIDVLSQLQRG